MTVSVMLIIVCIWKQYSIILNKAGQQNFFEFLRYLDTCLTQIQCCIMLYIKGESQLTRRLIPTRGLIAAFLALAPAKTCYVY